MKFQFFTLGGKQLWEDVFYYQKWRIQRHCRAKKYRLLDNFDICRWSGSFEDCRKAFVKFIEVYEIPRQKGPLVILLHGLGESKDVFRPLWRALNERGYNVAAVNYPSLKKPLKAHLDQLDFFLSHTEDISEVSFVTNGTGCLILRYLLTQSYAWQEKFNIGKVINVNPKNCGSAFFETLSHFKIFNWILGPSLTDLTPKNVTHISRLPAGIPLGLIFCETLSDKILAPIKKRYASIPVPGDETEEDFSTVRSYIKNVHPNIFKNRELINNCMQFLENGKF